MKKLSTKKKRAFWLITIISLVLMIAALEWLFGQWYYFKRDQNLMAFEWDSETFWKFKPGYRGKAFGRLVEINEGGFRGPYYKPDDESELRIIAMGDSRTYGFMADEGKTFSRVLEAELNDSGLNAQVINAGVLGYSAMQTTARFEQLLHYKPDIVIYAPGHNDRRYVLLTPPDSPAYFRQQARLRSVLDVFKLSRIFHGLLYELSSSRLQSVLQNPPPLNEVDVRVNTKVFDEQMKEFVSLCRENGIKPLLLWIPQNPLIFEVLEQANALIEENKHNKALALLEAELPSLHGAGQAYCHYLMGQCYESLGEEEQARFHYNQHEPLGSLHGEALLRSQTDYYAVYEQNAGESGIPLLHAESALREVNQQLDESLVQLELQCQEELRDPLMDETLYVPLKNGRVNDLNHFVKARYTDECHQDNLGHILMGLALTDTVLEMLEESNQEKN